MILLFRKVDGGESSSFLHGRSGLAEPIQSLMFKIGGTKLPPHRRTGCPESGVSAVRRPHQMLVSCLCTSLNHGHGLENACGSAEHQRVSTVESTLANIDVLVHMATLQRW